MNKGAGEELQISPSESFRTNTALEARVSLSLVNSSSRSNPFIRTSFADKTCPSFNP
jgi:hypothetical protein